MEKDWEVYEVDRLRDMLESVMRENDENEKTILQLTKMVETHIEDKIRQKKQNDKLAEKIRRQEKKINDLKKKLYKLT